VSKSYVDQSLMHNSSLSCFLMAAFVRRYEELTAGTSSPELIKLLLILPIVWHRESCLAVKGRSFSTSLQAVLADSPLIKSNFQERIDAYAPVTLQGINLACATGLLIQTKGEGEAYMSANFDKWPKGSKPTNAPSEMLVAIPRLASWFKDASSAQLYSQFLGL